MRSDAADQHAIVIQLGAAMQRTRDQAAAGWTRNLARQWIDLKRRRDTLIGSLRAGMRVANG